MAGFEDGAFFADRYEIQHQLGRGGMGMVYLAKDFKTEQLVALKTLLPRFANNKQAVARFVREINAARRIDHPSVVKIFDAGNVGGTLYYAMEYVKGKSVRTWMRERKKRGKRVGLNSAVRILGMVCSALEKAHTFTIHRDLSPENVMVTRDGQVKLLDFGLAKLTETDQNLTRVGVTLGKIQYSSPEQRADAKSVDHRADIYSLGVMFYEMLGGSLPKPGIKLSQLAPWLPPESDAFVERAMADDPNDRYGSAREFRNAMMTVYQHAKELETARADDRVRKRNVGSGEQTQVMGNIAEARKRAKTPPAVNRPPVVAEPVEVKPARGLWARIRAIFSRRRDQAKK